MASLMKTSPACSPRVVRNGKAFGAASVSRSIRPNQLPVAQVAEVTPANYEADVLKADKPVVVDFWAPWCGPCKLVAPLMDWAEKEYDGVLKVVKAEHGANPKLIEEFKVYGLPALVLMKDGKLVPGSKREGAITKALFVKWLKDHGIEPKK